MAPKSKSNRKIRSNSSERENFIKCSSNSNGIKRALHTSDEDETNDDYDDDDQKLVIVENVTSGTDSINNKDGPNYYTKCYRESSQHHFMNENNSIEYKYRPHLLTVPVVTPMGLNTQSNYLYNTITPVSSSSSFSDGHNTSWYSTSSSSASSLSPSSTPKPGKLKTRWLEEASKELNFCDSHSGAEHENKSIRISYEIKRPKIEPLRSDYEEDHVLTTTTRPSVLVMASSVSQSPPLSPEDNKNFDAFSQLYGRSGTAGQQSQYKMSPSCYIQKPKSQFFLQQQRSQYALVESSININTSQQSQATYVCNY